MSPIYEAYYRKHQLWPYRYGQIQWITANTTIVLQYLVNGPMRIMYHRHGCCLHPNMSKMRVRRYDAQTTIYRADGWVSKKSIFWQHHSICICHTLLQFKRFCHVQTFLLIFFNLSKLEFKFDRIVRVGKQVTWVFLRFEGSRQNSVINCGSLVPKWSRFR